ncbi:MAG: peptide-methionine (S)-S-oxide reductase MsrA [Novosphingobium sp.]
MELSSPSPFKSFAVGFALGCAGLTAFAIQPAHAAERAVLTPPAAVPAKEGSGLKVAIFSGGCFWGVEGVFSHVKGVTSAVSGYQGGDKSTARYDRVSDGNTGHAESVRVTYDPAKVRYDQLLRVYFSVIVDPTQVNRQGPDTGPQYRSALVPLNEAQRAAAAAYLAQLRASHLWQAPIATRIEPYKGFYPAEAHHQDFMANNPDQPYIVAWDNPRLAAFKRLFPALYKPAFTRG